jgi:uncharacterized protein YoxC
LSIVAQNTVLEIKGVEETKVADCVTDYPKTMTNGICPVELGDLYAEEQRNVLSKSQLNFPPHYLANATKDVSVELAQIKLSCINLVTKKPETQQTSVSVTVRPSSLSMNEEDKAPNMKIEIQYNRYETAQTMQKADKMCDDVNKKTQAQTLLTERIQALKELEKRCVSSSCTTRDVDLLGEMQSDLLECQEQINTAPSHSKQKKCFMQNKINKLGRERGNDHRSEYFSAPPPPPMNAVDTLCSRSGGPPPASMPSASFKKSVFETRSKTSYKKSYFDFK